MRRVVVNVDGGSRGNPGPAAVAAVATTPDGAALREASAFIGSASNNVAEYRAVELGLELAADLGASEVDIVCDSELVAKQLRGTYRVKNAGLRPLYERTHELLSGFSAWSVTNVARAQNEHADRLVNEALDQALADGGATGPQKDQSSSPGTAGSSVTESCPGSATRRVVVNVDGGSRGNPGPAAVAAVATTPDGAALREASAFIGSASNNVAEYRAVELGLELAADLGASEVDIVCDSELVAKQLRGTYRVKNAGLRPLYERTHELLSGFSAWSVTNVARAQNEHADRLVNEALDQAEAQSG